MDLTRRDALAALSSAGIVVGGGAAVLSRDEGPAERPPERVTAALVAVADVVYPSAVSNVPEFVETYAGERWQARPDYRAGVEDAVTELDRFAGQYVDADRYADLETDRRAAVLDRANVDVREPDPDGLPAERVRYYVVNDLLFALYASPTGGRLVGIENPQGYPGGTDSYRRGPDA